MLGRGACIRVPVCTRGGVWTHIRMCVHACVCAHMCTPAGKSNSEGRRGGDCLGAGTRFPRRSERSPRRLRQKHLVAASLSPQPPFFSGEQSSLEFLGL